MNYFWFTGIDISKEWFDAAIIDIENPKVIRHQQFENGKKGFRDFMKWCKTNGVKDISGLFVSMEHTGVYTVPFCEFLSSKQIGYTLVPGAQISNSLGITRGKNDRVDAQRIARYAYRNRDDIRIHTLPEKELRILKALLAFRERLIKSRHAFSVSHKEMKDFDGDSVESISPRSKELVRMLNDELKLVEKNIDAFLDGNPQIRRTFDLLLSVPGIGRQIALHMIYYTRNFVSFKCPKKFASYAGVAPFTNSSGKSRNGTSRVSHKATKKMKALLTSGVVCSMTKCAEYRIYYERQIERGKDGNSIKNVIRNKIIGRAFAVIARDSPYVNIHAYLSK